MRSQTEFIPGKYFIGPTERRVSLSLARRTGPTPHPWRRAHEPAAQEAQAPASVSQLLMTGSATGQLGVTGRSAILSTSLHFLTCTVKSEALPVRLLLACKRDHVPGSSSGVAPLYVPVVPGGNRNTESVITCPRVPTWKSRPKGPRGGGHRTRSNRVPSPQGSTESGHTGSTRSLAYVGTPGQMPRMADGLARLGQRLQPFRRVGAGSRTVRGHRR